jgi:hypothetical protein
MGAPIVTDIAARRSTQVPSRNAERMPRSATGILKSAGAKGHQAGAAHQCAFRKHDQRCALLRGGGEFVGVLGALGDVEALDEARAETRQQCAHDKVVLELALGDEGIAAIVEDRKQH